MLLLADCGGGPGGGGYIPCVAPGTNFGGRAFYEDKLYDFHGFGARPVRPIRFAAVEVRDKASGNLLAQGATDGGGNFCIASTLSPSTTQVFARVKADASPAGGRVRMIDEVGDNYYVDSDPLTVHHGDANVFPAVVAWEDTPWKAAPIGGSTSFTGGAFNILDVTTYAIQFVKGQWGRDLPDLTAMWQAASAQGQGTYYDPRQDLIHVKGKVLDDSDEYDDDIVLHEFGHFVAHTFSKDTSPGGAHYINGITQDARLAWSEGWANFFSGMARDGYEGAYSNRSGVRASIIDSLFTAGPSRAVRFAFEMATPEAFLPDTQTPANEPMIVDPGVFKNRVKYDTSEVSVATALWDIYAGGSLGGKSWPGIGRTGMRNVMEAIAVDNPANATFASFWEAYEGLYPAQAAAVLDAIVSDRLMAVDADAEGADDTVTEVTALTGTDAAAHEFGPVTSGYALTSDGHTLYPKGDVDLFRVVVGAAGTVRFTTQNLNDGADTYLRVLAADGTTVLGANDNYIPYVVSADFPDDSGGVVTVEDIYLDYGGTCKRYVLSYRGAGVGVTSCPPNSANRSGGSQVQFGDIVTDEFLASRVEVALDPGTYYVEVTRSPDAPPSAGAYGGYDLEVTGPP